jgi:predicted Zn-dependent peptidase
MGTLLDALSQENLDNQREVVKNEKRWSYDNRPYGSWVEKILGGIFPDGHPYHHTTIGSMEDLDAASLEDVASFFRLHYAPNNAVVSVVGDIDPDRVRGWVERYFGNIPANPNLPVALPDMTLPPTLGAEKREVVPDRVPLPRIHWAFRAPVFGDPRLDALDLAGQILAGGKGSRLHRRLVREEEIAQDVAFFSMGLVAGASVTAGWATARPGVDLVRLETAYWEELERMTREPVSDDELARAKALTESDELGALQRVDEKADRLSMYATLFDDPGMVNSILDRYLSTTAEQIQAVCHDVFKAENRYVLTYVPAGAEAATDADAAAGAEAAAEGSEATA